MDQHPIGENAVQMCLGGPAGLQILSAAGSLFINGEPLVAQPLVTAYPQSAYSVTQHERQVMTDVQMELLRRQISVYSTICHQLLEMHKASLSQQTAFAGYALGQHVPYDQVLCLQKSTSRQRWTPSPSQLHVLEKLFDQGHGTPSKQRIKEIASELSQHGQISETNVYNWFQNRKARAKRKQQQVLHIDGASEAETETESLQDKKNWLDGSCDNSGSGQANANGQSSSGTPSNDQDQSEYASADNQEASLSTIIIHGKPWKICSGLVDVRTTFGETAVLLDSGGFIYPTNEAGITVQPLQAGESYTLAGLGDIMTRATTISSDVHNCQKVAGY
ncbi:hypothetical protein O6H91_05G029900 [Diphasiastrum complanatum]|uniref:Uncharacterized protein n=1 Tax=Diphasiastrum complanatum TaxID=34168 RepID=A0ACC2DLU6_DIPCM|nr:hypothetical protein O6H91_05G029900 [Diphasiastrum complanatum]